MKLSALAICLGLWGVLLGCQPTTPAPQRPAAFYPGELLQPASFGPNFQWRQRITATWKDGARSFDAVLAKDGNQLQLLGLSPMGMPGFVLRLEGSELHFENNTEQSVPFEPRNILLDVQRTFFPWFAEPGPATGTRRVERAGEHIEERWSGGSLIERRFRRLDGNPSGEIVVEYKGWGVGEDAPKQARLSNGWFAYTLTIDTLEQQRLP